MSSCVRIAFSVSPSFSTSPCPMALPSQAMATSLDTAGTAAGFSGAAFTLVSASASIPPSVAKSPACISLFRSTAVKSVSLTRMLCRVSEAMRPFFTCAASDCAVINVCHCSRAMLEAIHAASSSGV